MGAHHHTHRHGDIDARAHDESSSVASLNAIRAAFAITTSILVVEAVGGWWTGSVALIADAGHMLTDAGALGIALLAAHLSLRPRSKHKSFGYGRAEILAALANGLLLGGVSVGVALESIERLGSSTPVAAAPMLGIAIIGLLANLLSARILYRSGTSNLNVRAALAHVLGDALGSIAAIAAAVVILATGFQSADAIAGLGIAALLVWGAIRLIRESADILLEGAPRHLDLERISSQVSELEGVRGIHDLHIWTVSSGFLAMSGHVDLEREADADAVRQAVHRLLHNDYDIAHTTIQTEPAPALLEIDPPVPPG